MHEFWIMRSPASFRVGAVCLVILAAVVYIPSLGNGFVWDDGDNVAQKSTLTGIAGLGRIWTDPLANQQYYPLTHTTFWIEYSLWGLAPLPYHVDNILLHALCAVLILAILRRLAVPGAWLAAAFFVVHPVNVESVAWITERKNVLSGAFFFASALAYLAYARIGSTSPPDKRSDGQSCRGMYWWSLGLFICAVLSKTATCPLPLAVMLILWWKKDRLRGRDIYPLLPFLGVAAAMGVVTTLLERHLGASGSVWNLTLIGKTLVAGRALWFYAAKTFWPANIIFIYPRWTVDAGAAWHYLYPVAALTVFAALWLLRRRIGKGASVAVLYFVIMVGPALGFLNIYFARYSFVQDHFQYFGSIGLMALGAFVLAKCAEIEVGHPHSRRLRAGLCVAVAGLIAVVLGSISWSGQHKYLNEESLWRATIAANPAAAIAHSNLGKLLLDRGDTDEAGVEIERALRLGPQYAEMWCNKGIWLIMFDGPAKAIPYFRKALELNPSYVPALTNAALADLKLGRLDLAGREARRALQINNRLPDAHNILGILLVNRGSIAEAIVHFKAALRLDPGNPGYQQNLDRALKMRHSSLPVEQRCPNFLQAPIFEHDAC